MLPLLLLLILTHDFQCIIEYIKCNLHLQVSVCKQTTHCRSINYLIIYYCFAVTIPVAEEVIIALESPSR